MRAKVKTKAKTQTVNSKELQEAWDKLANSTAKLQEKKLKSKKYKEAFIAQVSGGSSNASD